MTCLDGLHNAPWNYCNVSRAKAIVQHVMEILQMQMWHWQQLVGDEYGPCGNASFWHLEREIILRLWSCPRIASPAWRRYQGWLRCRISLRMACPVWSLCRHCWQQRIWIDDLSSLSFTLSSSIQHNAISFTRQLVFEAYLWASRPMEARIFLKHGAEAAPTNY
jgi:hypothetical protein